MTTNTTTARPARIPNIITTTTWWETEDQIRLSDLPRLVPPTPSGARVSLASCYRWSTVGLRGVKLRRFRVAGSWATTRQELARWQAAMTAAA